MMDDDERKVIDEFHKSTEEMYKRMMRANMLNRLARILSVLGIVASAGISFTKLFGDMTYGDFLVVVGTCAGLFASSIVIHALLRKFFDPQRLWQLALRGRTIPDREMALSLTYLERLKERYSKIKLSLLACAAALVVLSLVYPDFDLLEYAVVSVAVLGLLAIKEAVVEYRISHGLFGTTRSEARELIDFIVNNSDDADFTDSNGNLRKALLPETARPDLKRGQSDEATI